MLIAYWPLAVLFLGLLIWAMSERFRPLGYVLFAVGCFYVVGALAGSTFKIGG